MTSPKEGRGGGRLGDVGGDDDEVDEVDAALGELLEALAQGVRSVQHLPVNEATEAAEGVERGLGRGASEFDFQSSLPEFRRALLSSQSALLDAVRKTLQRVPDRSRSAFGAEAGVSAPGGEGRPADLLQFFLSRTHFLWMLGTGLL
jgi:hypothetical protein